MKTIQITILVLVTFILNSYTQNTPAPPQIPGTGNSFTQTTTKISNSTSISSSGSTYKFKSKFQNSKRDGVEDILKETLSEITFNRTKKGMIWSKLIDGEIAFECVLTKRRLKIILNKEMFSSSFAQTIEELGEDLQEYVSIHKPHTFKNNSSNSLAEAEIRLEKAKEELEKSIKNLQKLKRQN